MNPPVPASPRPPRIPLGIQHMAASAFFFSMMSLLVKLAGERLPSSQLVLVRAIVCLFLSWAWLRRSGVSPWGSHPWMLVLRGLFGTVGLVCFYYTLVTLPLAESVVIAHTSPIFTAALAALLLAEPISRRLLVAIVCCAGGVLAIARPALVFGGEGAPLDHWGVAVGFLGAVASACVYVLIRRIRDRENPLVMVFYFPLVTLPVVLPIAIARWVWPTPLEWLMLLGLGVATQLAQIHMTRGLVLVQAGRATAVGYIQVALAALWGALFFDEVPDLLTLGGALLILAGTLVLAFSGFRRRARGDGGIVGG
ncbi:MAG TPA: DMT family transporter [Kofleriaceae bacterium]|nr:DMT family transporter [Kofleriaceae bacterium]